VLAGRAAQKRKSRAAYDALIRLASIFTARPSRFHLRYLPDRRQPRALRDTDVGTQRRHQLVPPKCLLAYQPTCKARVGMGGRMSRSATLQSLLGTFQLLQKEKKRIGCTLKFRPGRGLRPV
jgi:hypothetical protein